MRRMIGLLALTLLLFSGCSLLAGRFEEPAVQLADLRFEEVTLFETGMTVTIRIENDNSFPLTVHGSSHELYLNDTYVGKGHSRQAIELPPHSSSTQEIKVYLSNLTMLGRIAGLVEQQRFAYRLESDLSVGRGFGRRSVEITKEGRLDLPQQQAPNRLH